MRSYMGDTNAGLTERSRVSSSSLPSKKSKGKSGNSNSEKPKQPQRGLGVAQLEKIRLHSQMASYGYFPHHQPFHGPFPNPNPFEHVQKGYPPGFQPPAVGLYGYSSPPVGSPSSYGYHPNYMMGMGGQRQPCTAARWNPNNDVVSVSQQHTQQPSMVTRHLLSHVEQNNIMAADQFESMSSNSQNPESIENEELDLELRL